MLWRGKSGAWYVNHRRKTASVNWMIDILPRSAKPAVPGLKSGIGRILVACLYAARMRHVQTPPTSRGCGCRPSHNKIPREGKKRPVYPSVRYKWNSSVDGLFGSWGTRGGQKVSTMRGDSSASSAQLSGKIPLSSSLRYAAWDRS